jgi:hypothetical protein
MKVFTSLLLIVVSAQSLTNAVVDQAHNGIIKGTVVELQSGEKLSGANIIVHNTLFGAASDSKGNYQIIGLVLGTYTLECSLIGYKSISITDVQVKEEKPTEITFLLSPTVLEHDEITVNFQIPKKFHSNSKNDVDPDFTILVDESVDPDMIVAVDPSVDPGIFMNTIKSSIASNSGKDNLNIRILDSIKEKSKSDKKE